MLSIKCDASMTSSKNYSSKIMKKNATIVCRSKLGAKKILVIMKLMLFLTVLATYGAIAGNSYAQSTKLNLNYKNKEIKFILDKIEENSEYFFMYNNKDVDVTQKMDLEVKSKTVFEILDEMFEGTGIAYTIRDRHIMIYPEKKVGKYQIKQKSVSGKVTDENGEELPGVTVVVKGTTNGTVTNYEGRYSISNLPESAILQFSFVGMIPQEILVGNQTTINVNMQVDAIGLEEVVAIGYGIQKKVNLTGSVATVETKALESRAITNMSAGLSGLASGIRVTQTSGGKAGQDGASIRIRGITSFGTSNDPLVIVDGIPSSFTDIDPNDIENISILKDAASATIYGSRASAGVILISTKRGKTGKLTATYNGYGGWQQATTKPDLITDFPTWAGMQNLLANNDIYSEESLEEWRNSNDPLTHPNTDWFDVLVGGKAYLHSHNLSFSGGTKLTRYRFSLSYLDQEGLTSGNDYKRYGIRTNIDSDIVKGLNIGTNIFFRWSDLSPNLLNEGQGNVALPPPSVPAIQHPDGRWGGKQHSAGGTISNPFADMENRVDDRTQRRLLGDIFFNWNLIDGLNIGGKFSLNYNNQLRNRFGGFYELWNFRENEVDRILQLLRSATSSYNENYQLLSNFTIDYTKSIGRHNFKLFGGYEQFKYRGDNLSASNTDYPNNEIQIVNAGSGGASGSGSREEEGMQSVFGRFNYDLDGKYLFEAVVRTDGSSRFRKGKRWSTFPSFSAGWRISEENFMQKVDFVSNLKLKASWGMLGNNRIVTNNSQNRYPYQFVYSLNQNYSFNNDVVPGIAQTKMVNEDISWETTTSINLALDAGFFDNRFTVSTEYYNRVTEDVLAGYPVPGFLGAKGNPVVNLFEVTNWGWEADFGFHNTYGSLKVDASANFTYQQNEVTDYFEDIKTGGLQKGLPLGTIWGYEANGLIRTQEELEAVTRRSSAIGIGDVNLVDNNGRDEEGNLTGKPDGKIDSADETVIGNSNPKYLFGANIALAYKNFDLSTVLQGIADRDVRIYGQVYRPGSSTVHEDWLDAWSEDNPKGALPRISGTTIGMNDDGTSFWLKDASFLRVKNLQVGYTIPKYVLSKYGVEKFRIYVSSDNLLTLSSYDLGFDVESASSTAVPNVTTFVLGVNIKF
ncbi:SusC/RagA family TonB-linked outer membrane protein [Puteibacter caeruleilacunae]|nr:SusC/RagA family TonB-linked outer membrane protein [Puteibacter caeruleilacunae]